jgi:catechol 2,3-dioxygenase-like lactoylglutathione lyase family enzyme
MITFYNTIVFVKDLDRSKAFYAEILGQRLLEDYGTIVFFENHLVLHNSESIIKTCYGEVSPESKALQGRNNLLIYFETDNLEGAFGRVSNAGCEIIHPIKKQEWGQSVFRFLDPDNHVVEIGEPLHLAFSKEE